MVINNIQENTSIRAPILAGLGSRTYSDVDELFEFLQNDNEVIRPHLENFEIYRRIYDRFYHDLYENMIRINSGIEELRNILP